MRRKLPSLKHNVNEMPEIQSSVLSKVSCVFGFTGTCGSGKTHLCLSIIKAMRKEKSITKLFIISPTYDTQPIFTSVVKDDDFVFTDTQDTEKVYACINDIERMCNELADAYYEQLEWQLALKRFMAADTLSLKEEHLIQMYGYTVKNITRPSPACIIDDMSHSPLLAKCTNKRNPLNNLILRHRHQCRSLGLSVFILAQDSRGIPKVLRMVMSHGAFFATGSEQEIKNYWLDCGSQISLKHFSDLFKAFTATKYGYLFFDRHTRQFSDSV
jgi:tRNA A37 threonylcarbamoyladenosine biosynthesis protein TsaE